MIETFSPQAMQQIRRIMRGLLSSELDLREPFRQTTSRQAGTFIAKVATTITARSGTTPGSGTATLQDAAPALSDASGETATLTVTVYNLLTSTVAIGDYVVLTQDQLSGLYWLVQAVSTGVSGDIFIKNNTGAVIPIYNVLSVDDHIEDPETDLADYQASPPTFGGNYCDDGTPGDWGRWCVLQEEAAIGATVAAKVHGITVVEIDKTTAHPYPFVDVDYNGTNSTILERSWHGAGEILHYKNFAANEAWATIRIGNYQAPLYRAIANEEIPDNDFGDVIIQYDGQARNTVTLHNKWMEGAHHISQFDELVIRFNREENRWMPISAEC